MKQNNVNSQISQVNITTYRRKFPATRGIFPTIPLRGLYGVEKN